MSACILGLLRLFLARLREVRARVSPLMWEVPGVQSSTWCSLW